jgi:hypothetical protein
LLLVVVVILMACLFVCLFVFLHRYNNQWIIVDYKQFTPGESLGEGLLWIAEQIPGYVVSSDETATLEKTSYWASYNIPYFPFVYNISGYPPLYQKYGNEYSYQHCARANIFRRDVSKVSCLLLFVC